MAPPRVGQAEEAVRGRPLQQQLRGWWRDAVDAREEVGERPGARATVSGNKGVGKEEEDGGESSRGERRQRR